MKADRFQPNGPVRDPAPRDWWRIVRETVPLLVFGATVLGVLTGWIRTDATGAAESRYAIKRQENFEALTDQRLREAWARMDQIDRDRDGRTTVINKRVDDVVELLRGQIDGVSKRLDQRSEKRGDEVNAIAQRLGALELKVCVLSGLKVSQCK